MRKVTNKVKYEISKLNPLDIYLKENGLTRYKLTELEGLPKMTLAHAARRSIGNLECRFIVAIARAIHKNPGVVMNEMLKVEEELDKTLVKKQSNKNNSNF